MSVDTEKIILCVDDEPMILNSLREQLRSFNQQGFTIETAQNGTEALELVEDVLAEGAIIYMVISDQIMPGIKGDALLSQIYQKLPNTRTLLLTGQADLEAVQYAINQANLFRYLSKPWEQSDLLLTVQSAIDAYEQEQAIEKQYSEIQALNQVFTRFVPIPFLRRIAQHGVENIQVGFAQKEEISILFLDIRDFTPLSEQMQPEELFLFLNIFFTKLSVGIHQQGGFIDKYIGDAIMGIFDGPTHQARAIQAGLAMLKILDTWNQERIQQEMLPIKVGIGIHAGEVMMGTVGSKERMDSTVIGDSVNVAARLEGLTKTYGCPLLISEELLNVAQNDGGPWHIRCVDHTMVKGRHQPVRFLEVYQSSDRLYSSKKNHHALYEQAFEAMNTQNWLVAYDLFQKYHTLIPEDPLVQVHLQTIQAHLPSST